MRNSLAGSVTKALFFGVLAIVVSLPLLLLIHRTLGLGQIPFGSIAVLGSTVIACFALAAAIGAVLGQANGNAFTAGLLGFVLGTPACFVVAPFYGGLVVEGLTRDATGLVMSERGRVQDAARSAVQGEASNTFQAAREGRLREQLATYRQQAQTAITPQARAVAVARARELAGQIALEGKAKGVVLLKSGAARSSSFALLLWAVVGSPLVAALACRNSGR